MIQIFIGALIRLIGELLTTTILHSAWDIDTVDAPNVNSIGESD